MKVRGSPLRASLAVLVLGMTATAGATWALHRAIAHADRARFDNAVASVRDRIQRRLVTNEATLLGAKGVFAASGELSIDQFRRYCDTLELEVRYPGIQGIGFSRRVSAAEKDAFEAEMRKAVDPAFRIWPDHPRAEYHTIAFLEPLDRRNLAALGYDMFSDPVRNVAMARARDTGLPAASGRVTLVQEIDRDKQAGFLIYVPVYRGGTTPHTVEGRRAALLGFVYSPFRARDLLGGIFGTEPIQAIAFTISDADQPTRQARLYQTDRGERSDRPRLTTHVHLPVYGRMWRIEFQSRQAFDSLSQRHLVLPFLLCGLLVAAALALVVRSQGEARRAAESSDRAARAERAHLHRLFMQAPAALAIVRGPELRYELSNPLNQELTGGRDLIGKPAREALPDLVDQGIVAQVEEVYRTGKPFIKQELPVVVQGPGGPRTLYLNGTLQPLQTAEGTTDGVMVFAYEVTEQVRARRAIEALAEDLRSAVRARDDFLSIAGHELNTPLAALQLHVQGLLKQVERGALGSVPAALTERLEKAARQVVRLERLVGELLDVSRISSGRLTLQPEPVDLSALAREVAERFGEQLRQTGSALTVRTPVSVVGRWDRLRLDQVLSNLLGNAIKYGAGRPIEIEVHRPSSRTARLTVRDHGIGIPPEDADRIFGRFERAVSSQHYGGLGLGLWISRQIVEALHGRIYFEPAVAGGTTFVVELPIVVTDAPHAPPPLEASP